eukprot:gene1229-713_t
MKNKQYFKSSDLTFRKPNEDWHHYNYQLEIKTKIVHSHVQVPSGTLILEPTQFFNIIHANPYSLQTNLSGTKYVSHEKIDLSKANNDNKMLAKKTKISSSLEKEYIPKNLYENKKIITRVTRNEY